VRGLVGIVIGLAATAAVGLLVVNIAGQTGTTQPWSLELGDNFVFVRSMPAIVGLGVLYGLIGGFLAPRRSARRADGAVRRFSGGVIFLHALVTLGVLLALPTGLWQYLGGILDEPGPLPVYLYYRIHYIGAAVVLASVGGFVSYWWMTGDRSLIFGPRDLGRHLRGFAQELPPRIGTRLAKLLKLDLGQPAGSPGTFTFYEKVFQFPGWTVSMGLITVTGLVKLLKYTLEIPGLVVFVVSTLHVTAMVMILVLTLDHLRYMLARWPLMVAITTGWLPPRRGEPRPAPAPGTAAGSAGGDI
jgi:hypothetical protein